MSKKKGDATSLTKPTHNAIVALLRACVPVTEAAEIAGVSRSVFYAWLDKGRDPNGHPIYRNFARDVDKARAQSKASLVAQVRDSAKTNWKAAAWLLERLYPGEFAQRRRVEHQVGEGSEGAKMPAVYINYPSNGREVKGGSEKG